MTFESSGCDISRGHSHSWKIARESVAKRKLLGTLPPRFDEVDESYDESLTGVTWRRSTCSRLRTTAELCQYGWQLRLLRLSVVIRHACQPRIAGSSRRGELGELFAPYH